MGAQENSPSTSSVLHRTPQSNAEDSEAKQILLAFLLALTICSMIVMVTVLCNLRSTVSQQIVQYLLCTVSQHLQTQVLMEKQRSYIKKGFYSESNDCDALVNTKFQARS